MKSRLSAICISVILSTLAMAGCAHQKGVNTHHADKVSMKMTHKKMMQPHVIEIASFKLKNGVTYEEFASLDKQVETQHVAKQPGFISRNSAKGKNGEWIVVVHWETEADAENSMNSFSNAPLAGTFMSKIDLPTMKMAHYSTDK